ncbi:MAG TPA: hypothetical protein VF132_01440 [Rudaea sp.]
MTYSEDWSLGSHEPRNPLSVDAAADRHAKRLRYAVAISNSSSPDAVILMTGKSAQVEFFDENRRAFLSFQFQEKKPDHLFLSMATHRVFSGGNDKPTTAVTFTFQEDGSGYVREYDGATKQTVVRQIGPSDVSHHWEPYPEFGRYEGLLRRERA